MSFLYWVSSKVIEGEDGESEDRENESVDIDDDESWGGGENEGVVGVS